MPDAEKTGWDKAQIVLQPVGGLLTALAVALVGIWGTHYLDRNKSRDEALRTRTELRDAKLKLYTELMSRREQSDTSLRQEMFKSIVGTFLTPSTAKMEQKVLSLELLADNFHESLDLAPLFNHVRGEVEASKEGSTQKMGYFKRLEGVAKLVSGRQIETLKGFGTALERGVNFEELKVHPEGIRVLNICVPLYSEGLSKMAVNGQPFVAARDPNHPRCITAEVMDVKPNVPALRDRLSSDTPEGETVNRYFWVDYYAFPLVDNTRLSHDQRFAVTLRLFFESSAQLAFVYFPGSHAGLKDKPFYDDMLQQLQLKQEPDGQPIQQ